MAEVKHNHELDFVCVQCGADPNGAASHRDTNHTWPPGKKPWCPACQAGVALTMVRKVRKDPEEPFVPEVDLFPWHSWCSICPWKTTAGAWRDAYDMAFYHSIGGKHIDPQELYIIVPTVAIPAVRNGMAVPGEGDPPGSATPGSSDSGPGVPTGDPVREDPLDPYYDGSGSYY